MFLSWAMLLTSIHGTLHTIIPSVVSAWLCFNANLVLTLWVKNLRNTIKTKMGFVKPFECLWFKKNLQHMKLVQVLYIPDNPSWCMFLLIYFQGLKYQLTFITLNKTSCPRLSFSLKKSCSGYVLAMSLLINFSQGDVIFKSSEYWSLIGMLWALHKSCQTIALKWWGIPFRTSSWGTKRQFIFPENITKNKLRENTTSGSSQLQKKIYIMAKTTCTVYNAKFSGVIKLTKVSRLQIPFSGLISYWK